MPGISQSVLVFLLFMTLAILILADDHNDRDIDHSRETSREVNQFAGKYENYKGPTGSQYRKHHGFNPYGNIYGNPVGIYGGAGGLYGDPYYAGIYGYPGYPYGNVFGNPFFGVPYGNPYGNLYGNPYGNPYGNIYGGYPSYGGGLYGNPFGGIYGNNFGLFGGYGYGNGYGNGLYPQYNRDY